MASFAIVRAGSSLVRSSQAEGWERLLLHSPVITRRRLGAELRRLRTVSNKTIEQAAEVLECSPAKISRLESGGGVPKVRDVRDLLRLYVPAWEAASLRAPPIRKLLFLLALAQKFLAEELLVAVTATLSHAPYSFSPLKVRSGQLMTISLALNH